MNNGVRLDLLLLECVGQLCKTVIEPRCKGVPIWDSGVRDIAAEKLKEWGVPSEPVTVIQAARGLGILGPDPNVIVIPNRRNRGRKRV